MPQTIRRHVSHLAHGVNRRRFNGNAREHQPPWEHGGFWKRVDRERNKWFNMNLDEQTLLSKGFTRQPSGEWQKPGKAGNPAARLSAVNQEPVERVPLVKPAARKEKGRVRPKRRFEITFTIHAVRPCDWDGWDCKYLQDWCVTAGLIPSDGWDVLSGRVLSRKVSTEVEEKTVIEIDELT